MEKYICVRYAVLVIYGFPIGVQLYILRRLRFQRFLCNYFYWFLETRLSQEPHEATKSSNKNKGKQAKGKNMIKISKRRRNVQQRKENSFAKSRT